MTIDTNQGRRLVEDATRGPWESVRTSPDRGDHVRMVEGPVVRSDGRKFIPIISAVTPVADADLTCWLRNNATELIDAVDEVVALRNVVVRTFAVMDDRSTDDPQNLAGHVRGWVVRARTDTAELDRLTLALHEAFSHPDFEYETTRGPRKGDYGPPDGDGWEDNVCRRYTGSDPVVADQVGKLDHHSCWERHDFYDEHHWRRRRPPEDPTP